MNQEEMSRVVEFLMDETNIASAWARLILRLGRGSMPQKRLSTVMVKIMLRMPEVEINGRAEPEFLKYISENAAWFTGGLERLFGLPEDDAHRIIKDLHTLIRTPESKPYKPPTE